MAVNGGKILPPFTAIYRHVFTYWQLMKLPAGV
jgi:hypothetical protein